MQKLNEGHLQVALHPTLLLLLHFLLLLQLPLLLLLPAAATKIRKRIKRIRENSSTISHLFVSSSRDGSSRGVAWVSWLGGLVGMVHWHKMPIRISSSQSVGPCAAMADAQGVEYSSPSRLAPPSPRPSHLHPLHFVELFANANCLSPPGHFINFTAGRAGVVRSVQSRPESVRLGLSIFMCFISSICFVVIPCNLQLIDVYIQNCNLNFKFLFTSTSNMAARVIDSSILRGS